MGGSARLRGAAGTDGGDRIGSPLGRSKEALIALFEPIAVGSVHARSRELDRLIVHLLQTDQQHRPVVLFQNRLPDLDRVVGPNRQEEAVERGVVELA
jgi:hypothetical protein